MFPEVGFGAEEAAEGPFVSDERVDVETLFGSAGAEAGEVLVLELGEFLAGLAVDELGLGIEAGFESVLGRDGLAWGSTRACGFFGVEPVGVDLT